MESGSWSLTWQLDWCEPEAPLEDSSIGFSVQESALRVLRDIMAPRILRLEDGVQSCPAAQTAFCTLCDGLQRIQRLAVQHLSSIPSNVLSLESGSDVDTSNSASAAMEIPVVGGESEPSMLGCLCLQVIAAAIVNNPKGREAVLASTTFAELNTFLKPDAPWTFLDGINARTCRILSHLLTPTC